MHIDIPHRIRLAATPTPIQKLSRLSEFASGPDIYIKRDDLTGLGMSGNKVRKLEFSLAEAVRKGCDTVITTGGIGSNHCRATAIAARQLGLDPCLLLRGEAPAVPTGNLLLTTLLDARIRFVTAEEYPRNLEIMAAWAEEMRAGGHKPYIIPEGASNEVGAWGYYQAAAEIRQQILKENVPELDAIVLATGSGGTQAGLLLGLQYYQIDAQVYGVNVCDDAATFETRIAEIIGDFCTRFAYPLAAPTDQIQMIDGYVGRGYAQSRPEERDTIRLVAREEGIILDPVYTGKAMHGLLDQIRRGRFTSGMNVLFIHTGGIFTLFQKPELFLAEAGSGGNA